MRSISRGDIFYISNTNTTGSERRVIDRPSLCLTTQGQPIFLCAANRFYRQGPAQNL